MSKKKLLICLITLFFIASCDKNKNNHIVITNNYNLIVEPIFTPNTIATIKQTIISDSLMDKKTTQLIIEANKQGFVEQVLTENESFNINIDYDNKTIHYNNIDATLTLDHDNNITAVFDLNQQPLASPFYNDSGQLFKLNTIRLLTEEKSQQAFVYDDNRVVIYAVSGGKNFTVNKLFYNPQGQLSETIRRHYIINDDKFNTSEVLQAELNMTSSARQAESLKANDIKCLYLEHNQYGDWTKGYCLTGTGIKFANFHRQLEYALN